MPEKKSHFKKLLPENSYKNLFHNVVFRPKFYFGNHQILENMFWNVFHEFQKVCSRRIFRNLEVTLNKNKKVILKIMEVQVQIEGCRKQLSNPSLEFFLAWLV